jgi:DNA-directed RNA polymerase sigma subunit (sigma70/sigma32)
LINCLIISNIEKLKFRLISIVGKVIMPKTCSKCKNRSSCIEICPEIEKILKRDTAAQKEKTFTELERKKGVQSTQGDDAYIKEEPDYLRGNPLDKNAPINSVEYPEPRGVILDDKQLRKLRQHVDNAILSTHKKQKRWFYAYMRCKTLKEVAAIANCTAENVRKQIQSAVMKVLDSMSNETENIDINDYLTPKKFKDKVILYTF